MTTKLLQCVECEKSWKIKDHNEVKCSCGARFRVIHLESISDLIVRCDNFTKIVEYPIGKDKV